MNFLPFLIITYIVSLMAVLWKILRMFHHISIHLQTDEILKMGEGKKLIRNLDAIYDLEDLFCQYQYSTPYRLREFGTLSSFDLNIDVILAI